MADAERTEWTRITSTHESVPTYNAYTYPIQKPETDYREYRIIKLRNGLKVTLVHDEKATKAAATLNVAVGHLSDPDDLPSLTLLCFRMLYKGTKEFPKEHDFIDFLNMNHGGFDAETDASNTTYHLNVAASKLPEALGRFSALFHCPLFSVESLSQELKFMTEQTDQPLDASLRVLTVLKHLSKNGHVLRQPKAEKPLEKMRKLAGKPEATVSDLCDDVELLKEIRRRLVEWWEKEYCSSRMDLCVVGKEPLDELAEDVATRFSPIRNRNGTSLPMFKDHPIGPDEIGQIVMIQAGADIPQLQVTFALENQASFWRHKPALLLSLLAEQKRQGSLHSVLESRHWITALRCAPRSIARGIDTIELTVDLTSEGFLNYRSVILAVFEFFSFLRSKSPLDAYHQRDCARLMSNGFRFSENHPSEPHSQFIAESMQRPYPPELLLAAPRSNWEWGDDYTTADGEKFGPGEQEKFQSYVEMARLENARVVLSARGDDFDKLDQTFGLSSEGWKWEQEPLRNTPYRTLTFDAEFLGVATRVDSSEFSLPGPNEFMPTQFISAGQDIPVNARPEQLRETSVLSLWRLQANVLKTSVVLDIRSPAAGGTLRKVVLNMLLGKIIQDALVGTAYAAFLAGHQFTILPTSNGTILSFYGYMNKLPLVVERLLDQFRNLTVDAKKLEETTQLMRAVTLGRLIRPPRALSDEFLSYLMAENDWTVEEIAKEVDAVVTPRELLEFRDNLRLHSRALMFVHGNVPDNDVINMADTIETRFVGTELTFDELGPKSLLLPPGCNFVRVEKVPNPEEPQSALTFYLQIGPITNRQRDAIALILSRLLFMSLANALSQIGRDVRCELLSMPGKSQQGIIISLQSEQTPDFLEAQVEAILDDIKGFLELLGDEDIKDLKRPFKGGYDLHPKNPADLATWYDLHLVNGTLDFDHGKFSEEDLKKVTMEDIRTLFMSHVHPSSTVRSKLSIHMRSQSPTRIKRVSDAAVSAFHSLLEQHRSQLEFDVSQVSEDAKRVLGKHPTLSEFTRFWQSVLDGEKTDHGVILSLIPTLIEKYPVGEEGEGNKVEGATYIESVDGFKSSYRSGN
ncbi:hypothetical protein L218DRAFT_930912 [Marasmius fiardii PR-910]|nr:hypothetical protein L218DRAFT_930912 [Marasmius fiardii PR-910]